MSGWRLTLLLTASLAGHSWADGGALQLSRVSNGTQVSVFTNPGVPSAGLIELSVLVQDASTHAALLDADLVATLVPQRGDNRASAWTPPICAATSATDLQAIRLDRSGPQNLLSYGAMIQIPYGGNWRLRLRVVRSGRVDMVEGEIRVADQAAPWTNYWHLLLLPVGAVAGFVGLQHRARRITPGPA